MLWKFLLRPQCDTAWKVFKYGVFSGQYFSVFTPNTGKYGQQKTPYLGTFHTVWVLLISMNWHEKLINCNINNIRKRASTLEYNTKIRLEKLITRGKYMIVSQRILAYELYKVKVVFSPKLISNVFNLHNALYNLVM